MAITVVNGTPAMGLEFYVNGVVDGSATPMWSGSLNPMGDPASTIVMEVSGYDTYSVSFWPVGWIGESQISPATSPEVTDNTTVALNIDVYAS